MKIVHFVAGLAEWNGMANTARQFMAEERADGMDSAVTNELSDIVPGIDMVHIHGAWLPVLWRAAKCAKKIGAKLMIRPAGSYDPIRLAYHGWKKKLVSVFEHRMLYRADVIYATCAAEVRWIQAYVGETCPKIEVTDIKRFFDLSRGEEGSGERGMWDDCRGERVDEEVSRRKECKGDGRLHLLYLGRRHPLKGLEYLEKAVKQISSVPRSPFPVPPQLKVVSNAFGEEKEKVWEWCEVLVLPTLSENFGRVVAEALERGKRVITTDGAPVWGEEVEFRVPSPGLGDGGEIWSGYGGRLLYLKGYRDGRRDVRVELLRQAIGLIGRRDVALAGWAVN